MTYVKSKIPKFGKMVTEKSFSNFPWPTKAAESLLPMMTYSEVIKQLMIERNLSQEGLAKELCVNQTTVGQWLRGKKKPSYENILAFYTHFSITPNELFGIEGCWSALKTAEFLRTLSPIAARDFSFLIVFLSIFQRFFESSPLPFPYPLWQRSPHSFSVTLYLYNFKRLSRYSVMSLTEKQPKTE